MAAMHAAAHVETEIERVVASGRHAVCFPLSTQHTNVLQLERTTKKPAPSSRRLVGMAIVSVKRSEKIRVRRLDL